MATMAPSSGWTYEYGDGEPPLVDLLLDQSLASREMLELFEQREVPHRVSMVDGRQPDRPAVYIGSEGPAGTFLYGTTAISFYFLSRFRPNGSI